MIKEQWDCIINFPFKKEEQPPKTWEEFCEMFPTKKNECFIDNLSKIKYGVAGHARIIKRDENMLPDHSTAEAILALCQLIQLRNAYNGDWVPDWSEGTENKYCIDFAYGDISTCTNRISTLLLYFKTKELRDEFLCCFRPLIEKLKPLYGIKEGGEE